MPHWTHSRIDFASRPFSYRFWNKAARPTIAYCRPSVQALGKWADGHDSVRRIKLDKLSRVLVKVRSITSSDVSTHLRAGLKKLVGLDLRWDTA